MKKFPVIDSVRKTRKKISEEHDHKTEAIVNHYKEMESKSNRKIFERQIKTENIA